MFFILISKNIDLTICLIFYCGLATSGRILVGFVYASEFLTGRWRILYGTLNIALDGMTTLWAAIYFDWISKRAIYFESFGIILGILSITGHFLFIPESPFWLLKNGKIEEGIESLRYIMKFSGVECEDELDGLVELKSVRVNQTITSSDLTK